MERIATRGRHEILRIYALAAGVADGGYRLHLIDTELIVTLQSTGRSSTNSESGHLEVPNAGNSELHDLAGLLMGHLSFSPEQLNLSDIHALR